MAAHRIERATTKVRRYGDLKPRASRTCDLEHLRIDIAQAARVAFRSRRLPAACDSLKRPLSAETSSTPQAKRLSFA